MELQFYQFELLVIAVAFLSGGILRGIVLTVSRLSRSELDFYVSLEAASDLCRELFGVDEVSVALGPRPKRKLGSALHVGGVALRLVIQIAIAIGAPIATLGARDKGVIVDAVDVIEEIAYWSDTSPRSGIDANRCSDSGAKWNQGALGWACDGPGYSATLSSSAAKPHAPNATEFEGQASSADIGDINCTSCSLEIRLNSADMIRLREGSILHSEEHHPTRATNHIGELTVNFDVKSLPSLPVDCANETRIEEDRQWNARSKTNPRYETYCTSAVLSDKSDAYVYRIMRVSQNAFFQDPLTIIGDPCNFIGYEVDESKMAKALNASRSGNVRLLFLELMKKISYKKLTAKSVECKFTQMLKAKAVVYRKVVDRRIILWLFGILMPVCVAVKLLELRKWGSESDRGKFLRAIAARKANCMSKASSHELGSIVVGRLCFADQEIDSPLEYKVQAKEK